MPVLLYNRGYKVGVSGGGLAHLLVLSPGGGGHGLTDELDVDADGLASLELHTL